MNSEETILEVIIPVTLMAGRLDKLRIVLKESVTLPLRVTIVHDNRDNKTQQELCELIGETNSTHVKLIEGKFGSPGAARNEALKDSNADWIVFWDSDDLPQPEAFLKLIREAVASEKKFAVGQFEVIQLPNETVLPLKHHKNLVQVGMNPGLWRWAFNREHIKNVLFTEHLMGEDQLFLAMCKPEVSQVHIGKHIVYRYFKGVEGQLTSRVDAIKHLREVSQHMQSQILSSNSSQINFLFIMVVKQLATLKKYRLIRNRDLVKLLMLANRSLGKNLFITYLRVLGDLSK